MGQPLLERVEARLLAAGALRVGQTVAGLRAAEGANVVSAEDVRHGETLEALLCPSGLRYQPDDADDGVATAGLAMAEEALWEHNADSASEEKPRSASSGKVLFVSPPVGRVERRRRARDDEVAGSS